MKKELLNFKAILLSVGLLLFSFAINAQSPEFVWVKGLGGINRDNGKSIVVDAAGNVYTTGVFQDTISFIVGANTRNIITKGYQDAYISKQDSAGNFLWINAFGGPSTDNSNAITIDNSGNVYVTGSYSGTVDFDPGPGTAIHTSALNSRGGNGTDFFVSKFDASGSFLWVKVAGAVNPESGNGIKFDETSGDLYITGSFSSTVDFGFGKSIVNLTSSLGGTFVLRMKPTGDLVWAKALTATIGGSSITGRAIDVDKSGNVHVAGLFIGTVDVNPDPLNTVNLTAVPSHYDVFVSKLDSSGNYVWAKSMGGPDYDFADALVVDDSSNVYITGSFQNTANFDPNGTFNLFTIGAADIFVSKLNKEGQLVWAVNAGSRADDAGHGIALDKRGNVYTTGGFQSPRSEFNPGPSPEDTFNLVSYGGYDAYIWKLNNDGRFKWAMNIGTKFGPDEGYGIAVRDGYVYTTGVFYRTADFDPAGPNLHQMTDKGEGDAFILKLKDCLFLEGTDMGILGADSICKGAEYVYSVTPNPGSINYKWILPSGWKGGSNKDSIIVTPNGSGTISVIVYGECDSITLHFNVELAMNPVEITVDGMQLGTTTPNEYSSWQWYLEDKKINGSTDSIYHVEKNGIYSVVVTGKNGCIDTAYYTVTNATSILSIDLSASIKVYPNPVSDKIYIESPIAVSISIISIDGRTLYQTSFNKASNSVDISRYNPGLYLIYIKNKDDSLIKVEKLVIAK